MTHNEKDLKTKLEYNFKLCEFKINNILITSVIEENTNYINATYISNSINPSLCKKGESAFHNWADYESSKQFIEFVRSKIDNGKDPLFYVSKEEDPQYFGMYVHLSIIPQFLSWLSPFLALKISEIILMHQND